MSAHPTPLSMGNPGELIAALPGLLGFIPTDSLVLVTIRDTYMGTCLRVDLADVRRCPLDRLIDAAATGAPDSVIAVIVHAEATTQCAGCAAEHQELSEKLGEQLSRHNIGLIATHVVDRIQVGGSWWCACSCGAGGQIEDPMNSVMAAASVFQGRSVYATRDQLAATIAVRKPLTTANIENANGHPVSVRTGANYVLEALDRDLSDGDLAMLAGIVNTTLTRDILIGLAITDMATPAEELWLTLAQRLPVDSAQRAGALTLLGFFTYVRGDGPMAGLAFAEALRINPDHTLAGLLDIALQSGFAPDMVRKLAHAGRVTADVHGVTLPPVLDEER